MKNKSEEYLKIADEYTRKYKEMRKEVKGEGRFIDIAGNLTTCLDIFAKEAMNPKIIEKNIAIERFVEFETALKDYYRLLETYSFFKEAELSKDLGFCPELGGGMNSASKYDWEKEGFSSSKTCYVALAKRKLENRLVK